MTIWSDIRQKVIAKNTSVDTTMMLYRKIAVPGINMLYIVKPSFYIGQISSMSDDFVCYVDKFLNSEYKDWGEYLKFVLYIREISKRLIEGINSLQAPMDQLINAAQDVLEGEKYEAEDEEYYEEEYEEIEEPEDVEEPENINIEEIMEDKAPEDDETEQETESESAESKVTREDMTSDYEALQERLRVKIRQADVPRQMGEKIVQNLSKEIADVYMECIQLEKDLARLSKYPEGDISTLLSILIDIQYGLCHEMKRHLLEDIIVEEQFQFEPGLLTWTAHFLANFSEKINEEGNLEETGRR